jgi:hypothetical protein
VKILVCGGRKITDRGFVFDGLDTFVEEYGKPDFVVQGYAKGVDKLALQWAILRRIPNSGQTYRADWAGEGIAAGPIRNRRMLNEQHPDFVVAFPGDAGTHNMVEQSFSSNVSVVFVTLDRILCAPVSSFEALKVQLEESIL